MSLEQDENFLCPYCGESNGLVVDVTAGRHQEFVVDCEVCCRPIKVRVQTSGTDLISLDVRKEND
jgi:hypothetical protein